MEYNKQLYFLNPGDSIEGFYLMKSLEHRKAVNGNDYLSAVLSDSSGDADAKLWNYGGEFDDCAGQIVKIRAAVDEYKGKIQINIQKMRLAKDEDDYSINDIIVSAPIDSLKEMEYIDNLVQTIDDDDYRAICNEMLDRHRFTFGKIPAGKSVHHAFLSGLLMHTSNMLRIADFLASNIYVETVDRSLLLTGTLLHDLAKEREYVFSEYGLAEDITMEGMLIGHLVMGSEEINEIGNKLDISKYKITLLKHMLLSHHGKPEFGAAVEPCIAESELLSEIDMLDSRMEIYAENLEKLGENQTSDRIFALDKKILKHS